MKYPERQPQKRESYHLGMDYCDDETVVQDNGTIAYFIYSSKEHEKGWVLHGHKDKFGFFLWEENDRMKKWDDKITVETFLLQSKVTYQPSEIKFQLGNDFKIDEDEELSSYRYGGVLSLRKGWFVTKKENPNKILRSIQTIIS